MPWYDITPARKKRIVGQAFQPDSSLVRLESLTYFFAGVIVHLHSSGMSSKYPRKMLLAIYTSVQETSAAMASFLCGFSRDCAATPLQHLGFTDHSLRLFEQKEPIDSCRSFRSRFIYDLDLIAPQHLAGGPRAP